MNSFHKNRFAFIAITGIGLVFVVLSLLGLLSAQKDTVLSIVLVLLLGLVFLYIGIDSLRTKLDFQSSSITYAHGFFSSAPTAISPVRIDVVPTGRFVKYVLTDSAGQKMDVKPIGWANSDQMIMRRKEYIQQNNVQINEQAQKWFKLTADK